MAGLLDIGGQAPGGLLGDLFNDPGARLGMSLLAASSPRLRGLGQVMAQQDAEKQQALQRQLMQAQLDDRTLQTQARQAQAIAEQRKQQALPELFDQAQEGAQGQAGAPGGLNWQRGLMAGFSPEQLLKMAELQNIGRQEVARTIETVDAQNRPITVQLDKFGNRIGDGMGAWKAPMAVNQGSQISMIDPATMQARGTFGINMSPAERDAAARGWAGQALAREKFNIEQQQGSKPTFNAETGTWVYAPSPTNPQGAVVPVPGFQKPLNDVQSKALLFGTRMQEADKVLADLSKQGRDVSTPGANMPIVGGLVNVLNTEKGQMLDQAKRDFINATLRRESGAAISQPEFNNAEKQYFPQIGDSEKVIQQKARNRALATQGILAEVPKGTPPIRVGAEQQGGATGSWSGGPVPKTPMRGQVIGGFKFKGGDPSDQSNWEKQ